MTKQKTHKFRGGNGNLDQGKADEREIDSLMSRRYQIQPVQLATEIDRGIDRYWTEKRTGLRYSVEYKSDRAALKTGNAFLETISNDQTKKAGWIYTTTAQIIVYYVPGQALLLLSGERLKQAIADGFIKGRRIGSAKNETYYSKGALVPLEELEEVPGLVLNKLGVVFCPV